jgi:hypothetical protein
MLANNFASNQYYGNVSIAPGKSLSSLKASIGKESYGEILSILRLTQGRYEQAFLSLLQDVDPYPIEKYGDLSVSDSTPLTEDTILRTPFAISEILTQNAGKFLTQDEIQTATSALDKAAFTAARKTIKGIGSNEGTSWGERVTDAQHEQRSGGVDQEI